MINNSKQNKSFWEKELLPKFLEIYQTNKETFLNKEYGSQLEESHQKLELAKNKYHDEFNQFTFFISKCSLFFSILLLFIPFYWTNKWYKNLKWQKEEYLLAIEKAKFNKLEIHKNIANNFDFISFFAIFKDIIKYKHMGPIPISLIEQMQEISFDNIADYDLENTHKSSWGILDNKIIINKAKQNHKMYMETYTGSVNVYYTRVNHNGSTTTVCQTVTASYSHPAFKIWTNQTSYTFMESCSNLSFKFQDYSSSFSSKKFNKKNNFSSLENEEFDKKYNWWRSDDAQFRMIFTPYTQESYINEDKSSTSKSKKEMKWKKEKSFIFNEWDNSSFDWILIHKIIPQITYEFEVNEKLSYEDLISKSFELILGYYENLYKSLNFIWLTTLLPSEDHTNIIKFVKQAENKIDNKNISLFFHNILNEVFNVKIISKSTDCFNSLETIENLISYKETNLYKVKMKGLSYEIEKLVTYIPKWGPNGIVDVPVFYDNYIPCVDFAYLYAGYIKNRDIYYYEIGDNYKTNIQDKKIIDFIIQLKKELRIYINNQLISFYVQYDNLYVDKQIKILLSLLDEI